MYRRLLGSLAISKNLPIVTRHVTPKRYTPYTCSVRCMATQSTEETEKQHKNEFRGVLSVCAGLTVFTLIVLRYGWRYYRRWFGDIEEPRDLKVVPNQYAIDKATETQQEKTEDISGGSKVVESEKQSTEVGKTDSSVTPAGSEVKQEKEPELPDIPTHIKYLLIGGGTAAVGAYRAIKAKDAKAQVLVVGEEPHVPYFRPPLSKELWFNEDREIAKEFIFKDWNNRNKSVFYEPPPYYIEPKVLPTLENGGVGLVSGRKVIKLNPHKKRVWLDNGVEITYDKCLIATGGKPRNLPVIENADKEIKDRTVLFRTLADYTKLDEAVENSKAIAIVGGGFLGSELACALGYRGKDKGLKVYQIFPEAGNLGSVLPEYLSKWTANKVRSIGVDVIPNNVLKSVKFEDGQIHLTLSDGTALSVDHLVVSVGLEPNVDLAKTSGLEVDDKHGGFRVNAELEARTDVWIAGDAACFYDIKLGRRRVEHHDHAMVSGRLAGENMTGAAKPYWHQSTFWSDLGPYIGFEAIGLIDSSLETVAVFDKATEKAIQDEAGQTDQKETTDSKKEPTTKKEEEIEPELVAPSGNDEFGKGVLFYLKDKVIVGILMWNLMGRMPVARKVLRDGGENEDMYEVAKLFKIHES